VTRVAAWNVLRSGSNTPMREVDRVAREHELDPRDRALLRRIVGTEVRRRGTLRALVNKFAHRHSSPNFVAHLHLGLIQLYFMDRVPPHAAVGETVGAVRDTLGTSKVKAANGILRAAQRARHALLTARDRARERVQNRLARQLARALADGVELESQRKLGERRGDAHVSAPRERGRARPP